MDYTALTTNIQDICETTFTADVLAMFTQQSEQKIYNSVQIPALRKNVIGTISGSNKYLTAPSDFIWAYSLAVISAGDVYTYLINKDVNFMREAYPNPSDKGVPKHYAYFDDDTFILGPTPETSYSTELHYGYYPESIVTAGTTWLGENFDSALLNGALIEAIRFMKGEPDVVAMYESLYAQSITLLKNLGDGKLREDAYRSGQVRTTVS
tara:strand:+ start:1823 stop:2452 length:630 start_codon:yes stop_codon:yes gene_type:complete